MSHEARPRRRRRAGRPWRRLAVVAAFALVAFAIGIALGQALNDGPPSPSTVTYVRTIEPLP